jgi:antitoxin component of MazEF toxin-antitoxin module
MSFKSVSRDLKPWTFVTEVRFAVRKTPNGLAGAVTLPPNVTQELGWKQGDRLDVAVGTEDDAGWFSLTPVEANHRAKVKIKTNGVAKYTSNALVPEGTQLPQVTHTPQSRIEGNTLFLQLAAA